MTSFTKEEELQFTAANAIAYDLLRSKCNHDIPCWLCMSDEAKKEARIATVDWLNANANPLIPVNIYTLDVFCEENFLQLMAGLIEKWKIAELERKKEKALNNPLAFLCRINLKILVFRLKYYYKGNKMISEEKLVKHNNIVYVGKPTEKLLSALRMEPPLHMYPGDFFEHACSQEHAVYSNNMDFVRFYPHEQVKVCWDGNVKSITEHPQYEKWKNEMDSGEMVSFFGAKWTKE